MAKCPLYLGVCHAAFGGSSVVECLTQEQGAAGSSLTGIAVLCPCAKHIYPSLVLVQHMKTHPYITERLLMGCKESNQTKCCIRHGDFFVSSFFEPNILCEFIILTLNAPIATKVVCFSRLLKCLRSLHGKQRVPRIDLFWVHAVCFYI